MIAQVAAGGSRWQQLPTRRGQPHTPTRMMYYVLIMCNYMMSHSHMVICCAELAPTFLGVPVAAFPLVIYILLGLLVRPDVC
jgi:hypothetical protein